MTRYKLLLAALLVLPACGDGPGNEGDSRAALLAACETRQGVGWNKKQYGDHYCECWADRAKEVLSAENYKKLVQATRAELKAADAADREKIVMGLTHVYSSVSSAAGPSCRKKG